MNQENTPSVSATCFLDKINNLSNYQYNCIIGIESVVDEILECISPSGQGVKGDGKPSPESRFDYQIEKMDGNLKSLEELSHKVNKIKEYLIG